MEAGEGGKPLFVAGCQAANVDEPLLKVEGQGPQADIEVNFESVGRKILMVEYLEVVR